LDRQIKLPGPSFILNQAAPRRLRRRKHLSNPQQVYLGKQTPSDADASEAPPSTTLTTASSPESNYSRKLVRSNSGEQNRTDLRERFRFMNRRTAAKSNCPLQSRGVEQITERAGDDEILLYLPQIGPRRPRTPRLNIRPRDQESTSTGSLITSFHLEFLSSGSARDETSGFAAGFNDTKAFAFLTNGSSDLA